jgi:hypothetical protein
MSHRAGYFTSAATNTLFSIALHKRAELFRSQSHTPMIMIARPPGYDRRIFLRNLLQQFSVELLRRYYGCRANPCRQTYQVLQRLNNPQHRHHLKPTLPLPLIWCQRVEADLIIRKFYGGSEK